MSEPNEKEIFSENGEEKNEALRVPHIYVPSFTGASDNYRMASAAPEKEDPEVTVIEKTGGNTGVFDDDADDFESVKEGHEAQIVHVQVTAETDTAQTLFRAKKPQEEDSPAQDSMPDDEAGKIRKLISPDAKETDETEDAPEDANGDAEPKTDLSRYVLPDPEMPKEEEKMPTLDFVPMTVPAKKVNRRFEYVTTEDNDRYKNRFLDKVLSVRVRLCAAALLTVLFSVFAVLFACGTDLAALLGFGDYPYRLPLFDLQGCVCLLLLTVPETVLLCRAALAKKFDFSMIYPALFLLTALFDITAAWRGSTGYPFFSAFFGLAATVLLLGRYWDRKTALSSFRILSQDGEKTVVEKVKTADLDKETLALDGAIDEYRSAMARFRKTGFVSDFTKRIHTPAGHGTEVFTAFCVAVGLTVVGSIVALILGGDRVLSMLYTAALSLYFLPFFAFSVFSLPTRLASRKTEKEKGAILGTAAVLSYADVDVVAFADTEAFDKEDINIQHVRLFGENTYNDVFRDMTALFATVGGTLYELFSEAFDKTVSPAMEPLAEKNGIAGKVDGAKVIAGTAAYLRKNGVAVPEEEEERSSLTTRVMYAAKNGVLTAEFLISYSMSESFSMLVPHLRKANVIPLIYTRDPNLDNELFTALMREEDAVRVIKETLPEEHEDVSPSLSAGMVSADGKTAAVFLILTAKKLGGFFRRAAKIAGYLAAAAPLFALAVTLGGLKAPALTLILFAWQILSFGGMTFAAVRGFGPKK